MSVLRIDHRMKVLQANVVRVEEGHAADVFGNLFDQLVLGGRHAAKNSLANLLVRSFPACA
jgi:hypothetical protein